MLYTYCLILQYPVSYMIWCDVMWCDMIQNDMIWHEILLYHIIQHHIISLCSVEWHYVMNCVLLWRGSYGLRVNVLYLTYVAGTNILLCTMVLCIYLLTYKHVQKIHVCISKCVCTVQEHQVCSHRKLPKYIKWSMHNSFYHWYRKYYYGIWGFITFIWWVHLRFL